MRTRYSIFFPLSEITIDRRYVAIVQGAGQGEDRELQVGEEGKRRMTLSNDPGVIYNMGDTCSLLQNRGLKQEVSTP